MIIDYENLFSDDQAITADAASTNIIDLGSAKDSGPGDSLELLIQVTEAFNNLTTLDVLVQTDTVEAFSSPTTLYQGQLALAALTLGKQFPMRFPASGMERYMRVYYDVTGTAPTTGKVTAALVNAVQHSFD